MAAIYKRIIQGAENVCYWCYGLRWPLQSFLPPPFGPQVDAIFHLQARWPCLNEFHVGTSMLCSSTSSIDPFILLYK
ncbi:hypothetical protein HZ326_23445 [Fusarium oxysporum f. sp. albedinis]|nr:hypothetical protein HZ326_23445 [Fusarium oxysporum f. sp. albedinis]